MKTKAGHPAVKLFIVNNTIEPGFPKIPLYLRTMRHPISKLEVTDPGYWGLFGGGVEPGESALCAMIRELGEEWDCQLSLFNFAYVGEIEPLLSEDVDPQSIFRAEDRGGYGEIKSKEGRGVAYFEPGEILEPGFKLPAYFKRFFSKHENEILNYVGEPNMISPPFREIPVPR